MDKYPIGPRTIEKASKTQAGLLASALNQVLYSADNATVMLKSRTDASGVEHFDIKKRRYVCEDEVFRGNKPLPEGVPAMGHAVSYFETEKLLLAIRDYLEAAAIREVCD